jgi:phosphate transport system substrate-binding protein
MRAWIALAALLATAACAPPASTAASTAIACANGEVTAQGSSAQAAAMNAWIRDYQVSCPGATIAYASVGSGAGIRSFTAGTGDFAGSDTLLSTTDQAAADARCRGTAIHLPMLAAPIALAYNVPGVDELRLAPDTIAQILTARITAWNDPRIARDNPGTTLPAGPIHPVRRSDSSGTTDNLTRFLTATATTDWRFGAATTWPAPGGTAARGSNRVVAEIERTDGAIGYVEASYATLHHLPAALIRNAAGEFTAPSDTAAARMIEGARLTDLRLTLDYRAATAGAYPMVLITYELVCRTGTSAPAKSFLAYAGSPAGQAAAARLGYAPLPAKLRGQVTEAVSRL